MRTLVILATYNEAANLPPLVAEALASPIGADVLVVDDNSPDGTGAIADRLAASDGRVHVIHRAGKLGLGTASVTALRWAIENRYDVAVIMDADFSHPPRCLPELVAALDRCDVAVASRYAPGGAVVNWPLRRKVMSRCINAWARAWLGLKTRDNSGAYRAYRLSLMAPVLDRLAAPGYAYVEEILFRCRQAGMRFAEVPYTFEERRAGASKINMREAVRAVWTIARLGMGRCFRR